MYPHTITWVYPPKHWLAPSLYHLALSLHANRNLGYCGILLDTHIHEPVVGVSHALQPDPFLRSQPARTAADTPTTIDPVAMDVARRRLSA